MNRHSVPWSRVLGEGAIIVVSILLAFWIDAWWQARQESMIEQEYLAALIIEIDELTEEVDRTVAANNELNKSAAARIEGLRSGVIPDGEELKVLREEGWVAYRLRADLDTYTDLLSTGAVTTLSDNEVRLVLARLRENMDFEQETFDAVISFGQRLRPLLLQSLANDDLETLARIEEDMIHVRSLHNDRKQDVKALALEARTIIDDATQ